MHEKLRQNCLNSLKKFTTIVADSSEFNKICEYPVQDATTNPSLILKAIQKEEYNYLIEKIKQDCRNQSIEHKVEQLTVEFGKEILSSIPGRVSTEVDAKLSFNTLETIDTAKRIIQIYEKFGISRERILIKIASTWEGIEAARILKKQEISCNMTLIFSVEQAHACAGIGVKLISPFVGRVSDWYNAKKITPSIDMGVQLVYDIYNDYKYNGIETEIMAASFRSLSQIINLAGCDLLTISPNFLDELMSSDYLIERKLDVNNFLKKRKIDLFLEKNKFEVAIKNNAMAYQQLHNGIKSFINDLITLEKLLV